MLVGRKFGDCYFVELCVIWNICTHAYNRVAQCIVLSKSPRVNKKDSEFYPSESRVVTTNCSTHTQSDSKTFIAC